MSLMKRVAIVLLSFLLTDCLFGCSNKYTDTLSDLAKGKNRIVYLTEDNAYVPYIVLSDNYQGNVLLLRRDVMSDFMRISDYSSKYEDSAVDKYLSSDYLRLFTEEINELIPTIDIEVVTKEPGYKDYNHSYTISRKAFLLSYTEVDYSEHSMASKEGIALSYFTDDASRIAFRNGEACSWWLRTSYTGFDCVTWSVGGDGVKTELSSDIENGIRPAISLPGNVKIKESNRVISGVTVFVIE